MDLSVEVLARIRKVKLAVFDVDGVLTDGGLHYGPNGEELKVFNTLDGHGIKMLQESGVTAAIISGRQSPALARRASDLGVTQLAMGVDNKRVAFEKLLTSLNLTPSQCAGLGDDVIDLPFLRRCGFSAAVPAAPSYLKQHVHYVTLASGGHGAAREFCDLIMQAQGTWDGLLQKYWDQ
jgi:3-deoxy-D-manno-octulosonate 8-phosphate phosphatase (KDO 8-P phosphatase)